MKPTVLAFAFASTVFGLAHPAAAQSDPRYFGQVRAELQAMGFEAQCAAANTQAGTCRVQASASQATSPVGAPRSGRQFVLTLEYSDVTDTVYVFIDQYARMTAESPAVPATTRRLLEMNWEMMVGRFEWSPSTGDVRLSAVLNTDSNFDRRAFRGVVRSLLRLADRWADEVGRLTGSPVGESPAH